MFSACVAAVKSRPVLHNGVVIFSGPRGSWSVHEYCLHLKIEFLSCARGVSGVASLITTDEQLQENRRCCFLVQAMLPEGFPFHQFM